MNGLYLASARPDANGTIAAPRAADAIGAALRGVFGEPPRLPDDMARLIVALDRPRL